MRTNVVAALIERGDRLAAGQLVAHFRIEEDFTPDLPTLIHELVKAGKIGLASTLAHSLGPQFTPEFGRLVVASVEEQLAVANYGFVSGVVNHAGMRFLEKQFAEVSRRYISSMLRGCDRPSSRTIAARTGARIDATVAAVNAARRDCTVLLPGRMGSVFAAEHICRAVYAELRRARPVRVVLRERNGEVSVSYLELPQF